MRYSAYKAKPDRYNPEFIGIANRYGQLKLQRKISQSNRNQLQSDFIYKQKEDQRLKKIIQAKAKELSRLRQAQRRHQAQLEEKERMRQMEAAQLQALKSNNSNRRDESRRNREEAKQKLLQSNRQKKMTVDTHIQMLTQECITLTQSRLRYNKKRYQTVKKNQESGRIKVDAYHISRNLSSLKQYKKRINHQVSVQKHHLKAAEKHSEGIKRISESVNLKRALLSDIQSQIGKYKTNYRSLIRSSVWNREDELLQSRLFLEDEQLRI